MKLFRLVSRIITGLVFIISGTLKGIDPLGSAYKFHDYFQAFNLGFLRDTGLPLAIILCTVEFFAGFSVLTGIRQKEGIWIMLLLMALFTPLTLILALTNPVSDCGCFGDAIHLTNWQTFAKNIILLIPVVFLFMIRRSHNAGMNRTGEWLITTFVIILFLGFNMYNLRYLPLIDFLPYKTGKNIPEMMTVPENAPADEYATTFIYEKNGVRKEFTISDYPSNDSTWKFVDQRSILVKKGYEPPIHDFSITSSDNKDITGEILKYPGYTMLMVSKKIEEAGKKKLSEGFDLGNFCSMNQIRFYILTASSTEKVRNISNGLPVCLSDETTLKTIIRANPGYLLLKEGTILGKWSWANLPKKEMLISIIHQ